MKLEDNSGGFWTDLIIHRRGASYAIKQHLIPDERFTKIIADETISAIRGSTKHKLVVERRNGKISYHLFNNGNYSEGILQGRSPDGTPYEPLSPTTLKFRKWKGISRGASFILRETSQHILNGLKILSFTSRPNGGKSAEVGWTGEDAEIARAQNDGFATASPATGFAGKQTVNSVQIPARPFIGFSEELKENLQSFLDAFLK